MIVKLYGYEGYGSTGRFLSVSCTKMPSKYFNLVSKSIEQALPELDKKLKRGPLLSTYPFKLVVHIRRVDDVELLEHS